MALMPYLKSFDRRSLEHINVQIAMSDLRGPGDLNYLFTMLIKRYIKLKGESYQTYNDCVGALEACNMELYRRKVGPYEDKKIQDNGDVYNV